MNAITRRISPGRIRIVRYDGPKHNGNARCSKGLGDSPVSR